VADCAAVASRSDVQLPRSELLGLALVLLLAAGALFAGWRAHWFLTDDAFIAFRYIANRRLGFGYSWNPPPFLPVEGYTSFAWVLVLDAIWSVFGVEPPQAANVVSLLCAFGSLSLTAWAALQLCRVHGLGRGRVRLIAAVLACVVSQRTFLIWASSGLEAALWNLVLQGWVLCGVFGSGRPPQLAVLSALAALAALTRPEGALPVIATVLVLAVRARELGWRKVAACGAPLALVGAHLWFRRSYYGAWLPNTYYAKVVRAWPEAGLRYLAAFGLEYGYWLALPIWLWALWLWLRGPAADSGRAVRTMRVLCLTAPLGIAGFAVLIAGGDHFEYRALSFLVPLLALALAHGCLKLGLGAFTIAGFAAFSAFLPWTLYAQQHARYEWPAQALPKLAEHVAWPVQPIAAGLDALEAWLIPHGIGVRWEEHRAFWLHQVRDLPTREIGARACTATENPVAATTTIGVSGWVLPGCAVLDLHGLTDAVIAHQPSTTHYLGHDRRPPLDYVQRFLPNVFMHEGNVLVYPRPRPLTDEDIERAEAEYRARLH
jgi:arabinofuranosyltransferase